MPGKRLYCVDCKKHITHHRRHGLFHRKHRVFRLNEWKKPEKPRQRIEHAHLARLKDALPSSVNLSDLLFEAAPDTFPTDQGQQGCCTAEAGCADVALCAIKQGYYSKDKPVPTGGWSVAMQYWDERNPPFENYDGQDSGANAVDVGNALALYGVCFNATFPFHDNQCYQIPTPAAYAEGLAWTFEQIQYFIMPDQFRAAIFAAQQTPKLGSVRLAFPVPASFMYAIDHGGYVPMPGDNESLAGGHEMEALDYDDNMVFPDGSKGGITALQSWGDVGSVGVHRGLFYFPYAWFTSNWVLRQGGVECYQQASAFKGQPPTPGPTNTYVYQNAGSFSPSVVVTDAVGSKITLTASVVVQGGPGPTPLNGTLIANPSSGPPPLTVNFQATVSGGTPPYSYVWNLPGSPR